MKKKVLNFNQVLNKLSNKHKKNLFHRFTKYIVDYKIEDNNLRVYSNLGKSRLIKNTRSNQVKLNKIIIRNKIDIANKIDEYENTSNERLIVFIINMVFLSLAGIMVPITLFIGNYILFLLSIILFSFSTITTSIIMYDYYVLLSEIKNLKNITGYKKEVEFKLPTINLKTR